MMMMKSSSRLLLIPTKYKTYLTSSSRSLSSTATVTTSKSSSSEKETFNIVGGDGKGRTVILGTGWAGFNLALNLKNDSSEVRVVSPSNHFVFTPLLPSTAVGTLEFRCIQVREDIFFVLCCVL